MRHAVVIEPTAPGYCACVPDLPGCVATGSTLDEGEMNVRAAIRLHIDGLLDEGLRAPVPNSQGEYIEVDA
jgi:predicted RNase H-like HicB family nuclease